MKVLYIYDNFPSYRKDFFELLNEKLEEIRHHFVFFYGSKTQNDSLQETDSSFCTKQFTIVETKLYNVSFTRYKGFRKAFINAKPDVVVLQFHVAVLSYWWAYYYMKRHNIPYIIWDCNYTRDTLMGFAKTFRKSLVDFTYMKAAACISYGSVFRDYLIGLGRRDEDLFVAQNTINIEEIMSHRDVACSNRVFNHPIRFLFVGALIERKYVDAAVLAVANLIKDGYDIYFDIVGEGHEKNRIAEIIKEQEVEDRVVLHGAKHGDEVKRFFEKDDVFLLPGTGGLAVNEAMSYSMPIISTVGDETIVDLIDGNGILLEKFGDINEIQKALKTFLSLSEEQKKAMAVKSELIIGERASMNNMVCQHINAIEHVLAKKPYNSNGQ